MGNTDSLLINDRPGPLMEEALRNMTMGLTEAAVAKYKKAYELFKESGEIASAARALRLAAEAGLSVDLELAAKAFEEVGHLYLKTDITCVAADANFANSIYCLLSAGKTTSSKEKLDEFKSCSERFSTSLEGIACSSIITVFQSGNRNMTRDRIEGFKDVVVVPLWREKLLQRVLNRL